MGASVWMASLTTSVLVLLSPPASTGRCSAETMPAVTEPSRPSGLPIAPTG